jgi:Bacterial pre-peptidase C-terminal domain
VLAALPTALQNFVGSAQPIAGADPNAAYLTATVKKWPAGRIFKSLGTNTSLNVAEVEIQTETARLIWVPAGTLDTTGVSQSFTLVMLRQENLTSTPVGANTVFNSGAAGTLLEPRPIVEGPTLLADVPTQTAPVTGIAYLAPIGWTPINQQDHIVEVGFIPDAGIANLLAAAIGAREMRRRDSAHFTMPIPDEWLVAGCPVLPTFTLWDGDWMADGLIVALSDRTAKFSFTGNRISRLGLPTSQIESALASDLELSATFTSSIVNIPSPPVPITPGVPVTGIALAQDQQINYVFTMPAPTTYTTITVQTTGATGANADEDIFLRYGVPFDYNDYTYDAASDASGTDELITYAIAEPPGGTYYISLYAYRAFATCTLTLTLS